MKIFNFYSFRKFYMYVLQGQVCSVVEHARYKTEVQNCRKLCTTTAHQVHKKRQILSLPFCTNTKTCPYNVYPLKPHFYIAKLGYAGVYLFFLFLLQNIDCGYSLEPPVRGGSNVYPQSFFEQK